MSDQITPEQFERLRQTMEEFGAAVTKAIRDMAQIAEEVAANMAALNKENI
jgi:hypothetical protein